MSCNFLFFGPICNAICSKLHFDFLVFFFHPYFSCTCNLTVATGNSVSPVSFLHVSILDCTIKKSLCVFFPVGWFRAAAPKAVEKNRTLAICLDDLELTEIRINKFLSNVVLLQLSASCAIFFKK